MPSMRYSFGTPMVSPLTPRSTAAAKSGTGRSADVEALGSKPDMEVSISAASSTVRAIGPAWSSEEATATVPQREQRPDVGLMPTGLVGLPAGTGARRAGAVASGVRGGHTRRRGAGYELLVAALPAPGGAHGTVMGGLVVRAQAEFVAVELA